MVFFDLSSWFHNDITDLMFSIVVGSDYSGNDDLRLYSSLMRLFNFAGVTVIAGPGFINYEVFLTFNFLCCMELTYEYLSLQLLTRTTEVIESSLFSG